MTFVIHHVEIAVEDSSVTLKTFIQQYQFHLTATRKTSFCDQWLVQKGHVRFLLTKLHNHNLQDINNDSYSSCENLVSKTNTVFNVALEVKDVQRCVNRVEENGGKIIKPFTRIDSPDGCIELAIVKSCLGNVIHTLINSQQYTGIFLPGFNSPKLNNSVNQRREDRVEITHLDHVTLVCWKGRSRDVLEWYESCFGMKRFMLNGTESETDGFVIEYGDTGIRLKAMEYWACAEVGLHSDQVDSKRVTFVIAEPLMEGSVDQINVFLSEHGGEGIQHIGLHTPDIFNCLSTLQRNGLEFNDPPFTYYSKAGKLSEMEMLGLDVDRLRSLGILVDKEDETENDGYLMQKFAKPFFQKKTFFFEIIQRVGATGFGAGNITALWHSVQAFLEESKTKERTKTEG